MIEGLFSSYIVHQQSAGRPAIVAPRDRLKRLLAGRIPDLQLDFLVIDLDGARAELDTNCQVVLLAKPLVRELQEQARLADAYIAS